MFSGGRSGRPLALGLQSGRLRGGFLSTSLPRSSSRNASDRETGEGRVGLQSGRLRGGFLSTSLPGSSSRNASDRETGEGRASPSTVTHEDSTANTESSANQGEALTFIMNTCKQIQEQVRKVERRLSGLEQQQTKLSDTLKELHTITAKQLKDSFSVKGSTLEVSSQTGHSSIAYE